MIRMLRGGASGPAPSPRLCEFSALGPSCFTRVRYAEWGPERAEHVVICAHGLTRNGRDFDFIAERLARAGMRVVAPDLPGRGRSAPMANWHEYGTPLYLSVMTGLIARLDVPHVDWIGTSLGGHIGMELAALQGAPIRRLVLNDFGARIAARALQRISSYLIEDTKQTFPSIEAVDAHLREILAPFGKLTDAQWRHMAEHGSVKAANGEWRLNHDPTLSKQFWWPIMLDISLWQVWDQVHCPTLILRGVDSDLLARDTVEQMKRRGRAAQNGVVQSVEFPDCGHAPSLMNDAQVDVVEQFLLADYEHLSATPRQAQGGAR
jgi:pimeloyl-ACP methyl ester carboxylesterase